VKIKHNKKRNTAFVYELLINEATVAIIKDDSERKDKAISIIRKHFTTSSILNKHLQCYYSLVENQDLDKETSEKILIEAKSINNLINNKELFNEQTELIKEINSTLSQKVFNNFIPNYKTLATIDQIFSGKLSPKNSVILESQIVENMCKKEKMENNTPVIDGLTLSSFIDKFNEKYEGHLLENQKALMSHYISSFTDNALGLKVFLNDEIGRLKNRITEAKQAKEIAEDSEMASKTNEVHKKLSSFKDSRVSETIVLSVLQIQQLEKEIFENGD
tara:strand:+ start:47546 stop:48373 length:828 start_codon:yes stop_codon:yes gene_type:complete